MTEEFDIMEAFQQIRQRLHDARQPINIGSIAEALQPTTLQLNHDGMTVPPLPTNLDWTAIRRTHEQYWTNLESNLDEDEEDEENDDLVHIMDCMAWAYMPEEIQREIRVRFYNGIPAIHQIMLTIPDENQVNNLSITAAKVEVRRDNHTVHLILDNEVIAWYTSVSKIDDKYHPIFFEYDYSKLGRFFLGAAQILWNALGYPVCIESERYIWDDETTPWEIADDAELRDYVHKRIKQFGQLSGNSGVLKPKVRNARRRRNLL